MQTLERNGTGRGLLLPAPAAAETLDDVYDRIRAGQVQEGMRDLLPLLQRRRLHTGGDDWAAFTLECLRHPLRDLLHQDPFTFRAFAKPRGYAGDAVLLDFIYGREEGWPAPPEATELGRQIFEFTTNSSACQGVRARRDFVADQLDQLAEQVRRPHVLSVACGHLREALLAAAVKRRKLGRLVAFDCDPESLKEVERCHGRHGVEPVHGSVRQLLTRRLNLGQFDFVYSTGLFDYVPLTTGQRLTWRMFQMLRPRGKLMVANFLPGILDVGYMETYMAWRLIYRSRLEMLELSAEIPQEQIHEIRIRAEENQNIIFLEVVRK